MTKLKEAFIAFFSMLFRTPLSLYYNFAVSSPDNAII